MNRGMQSSAGFHVLPPSQHKKIKMGICLQLHFSVTCLSPSIIAFPGVTTFPVSWACSTHYVSQAALNWIQLNSRALSHGYLPFLVLAKKLYRVKKNAVVTCNHYLNTGILSANAAAFIFSIPALLRQELLNSYQIHTALFLFPSLNISGHQENIIHLNLDREGDEFWQTNKFNHLSKLVLFCKTQIF